MKAECRSGGLGGERGRPVIVHLNSEQTLTAAQLWSTSIGLTLRKESKVNGL